jgi:hypothetical protein
MDWGIVSIWHMPGAEHKALQEWSRLGRENELRLKRKVTVGAPAKVDLGRVQAM